MCLLWLLGSGALGGGLPEASSCSCTAPRVDHVAPAELFMGKAHVMWKGLPLALMENAMVQFQLLLSMLFSLTFVKSNL